LLEALLTDPSLLELNDVYKTYTIRRTFTGSFDDRTIPAVGGVSLELGSRETLALVGETGCGKTTTGRLVLRLLQPTSGQVKFRGENIARLHGKALRTYRRSVQAVFQDPWASLNPRMRAQDIVAEPLVINERMPRSAVRQRVADQFVAVGIGTATTRNFPHEFSGGQRQRIAIARALVLRPELVVLDEPVSSLDVSIAAQIMNLLKDLQADAGVAYLLIAHNLATVRYLSDHVAVMYLGKIVERASTSVLFRQPLHPYTQALISAASVAPPGKQLVTLVTGDVPSRPTTRVGCSFQPRCPLAHGRCVVETPVLRELEPGHWVSCHLY
jgi:peptide/nickel transport system ATP-binding protein